MVDTVFLIGAAICFGLSAIGLPAGSPVQLVPLGLLFWVLTALV